MSNLLFSCATSQSSWADHSLAGTADGSCKHLLSAQQQLREVHQDLHQASQQPDLLTCGHSNQRSLMHTWRQLSRAATALGRPHALAAGSGRVSSAGAPWCGSPGRSSTRPEGFAPRLVPADSTGSAVHQDGHLKSCSALSMWDVTQPGGASEISKYVGGRPCRLVPADSRVSAHLNWHQQRGSTVTAHPAWLSWVLLRQAALRCLQTAGHAGTQRGVESG